MQKIDELKYLVQKLEIENACLHDEIESMILKACQCNDFHREWDDEWI